MNLNESFDVSPAKLADLKSRITRLAIDIRLIQESFVRGGGKGGQKINKTANCVQLYYPPLGIRVRCQRERRRSVNRFLALRELVDRIEMKVSPETSERLQEMERIRRRKSRRKERTTGKYGLATPTEPASPS
ncbi:MAG: peptide chain release factor-like protein [Elusimicrobia bacterium]|nr:peptide chain release factor-like protein [Elusimicrobiota bacterium]